MNKLKQKLMQGEKVLGTHVLLNGHQTTEIISSLGYDYLWIDTEHTSMSLENVEDHLLISRLNGVASLVRVPWNDPVRMKPILEMGPDGIIIPMVNSYEEALQAVQACMYPPRGIRGYGPRRASNFGMMPLEEYLQSADDIMRIVQVEHIDAVRDLKRIVTVDAIDAFIIGPMDLSSSMGKLGKLDDPEVCSVIDEIIATVHEAGKPVGVSFGLCGPEEIQKWKNRGVDMISLACETDFIITGAQKLLADMQKIML